jgi:hypothetical protein
VFRYVDDILLFACTETQITDYYLPNLEKFLEVRRLKLSKQKSNIIKPEKESLDLLRMNYQTGNQKFKA